MMKIVLFALVCVAFTQVNGSELDDKIKEAIMILDRLVNTTQIIFKVTRDDINGVKRVLAVRNPIHIERNIEFRDEAITVVKNESKSLTAQAKEGKLPQEVIKCIAKEEEAAISSISSYSTKFQADMKELLKEKLAVLDKEEKNLHKMEETVAGRYPQDVANIKKCKDIESVYQVLTKLEDDYAEIMIGSETITNNVSQVLMYYERDSKVLTLNANNAITLAKNNGLKNMNNCMPKTF